MVKADFAIINAGSSYFLSPTSQTARRALERSTPHGQWQLGALRVDPKQIRALVNSLEKEGWIVG